MAGAHVTSYSNSASTNETTLTVTVSGAVANNLLIAAVFIRSGGDSFTTPTGWTFLAADSTGSAGAAEYQRIASGTSADDFVLVWTDAGIPSISIAEYSGLDSISPLESSSDIGAMVASATSIGTGTATPITANGLAISTWGVGGWKNQWAQTTAFAQLSIDNSFTIDNAYGQDALSNPAVGHASKVYTSTAAHSATWSTTESGALAWGTMAVYKEPAAGWSVTDVDTDESIEDGQTGVVVTMTGTVAATGKLAFLEQGGTFVEQTVTAEAAQTVEITVDYGVLTAGAANLYIRNPI